MFSKSIRRAVGAAYRKGSVRSVGTRLGAAYVAGHSVTGAGRSKKRKQSAIGRTIRRGFKVRSDRSMTMTLTKRKSNPEAYAQHHGLEKTGNRIIMHRYARCRPSEGRWKYVDQISGTILSSLGTQGVNDIGYFVLPTQFVSASVTFAALGKSLTKQAVGSGFFGQNPYQKTTGGAQTNNTAIGEGQDERLVLEKVEVKYTFVNASNGPVEMDVYVVTPRQVALFDISPSNNWATVMTGEGLGTNPIMTQGSAFGYATKNLVGQKPGYNASFNKFYRTKCERKFIIQPGANVEWTMSLHYDKVIDRTMCAQASPGSGSHPGLSAMVFAVTRGCLVKDSAGTNEWTYANTEVGVVATAEYFLKMPKGLKNKQQTTLAYPELLATATGTGKSRRAWDEASFEAYPKDPRTKFWDGYRGHQHVVLDEFRGAIDIAHLLRWFDRYPVIVEVKGSSAVLMATKIWITSNLHPRAWYPDLDELTLQALLRRITLIEIN